MFEMMIIGILYAAAQIFGSLEAEIFNTYLDHVLFLDALFITVMVVLSALVGLIMHIIFGIMSDNTRSRFGRRRPFLLFGGLLAGISMMVYAYSGSFLMALLIDVIAVGAASNAYYVAQRAIIPDLIDIRYRGRANAIANIVGIVGLGISITLFLILNEYYGIPDPRPGREGTIITQEGYIFALTIGGAIFILVGLLGFLCLREPKAESLPPKKPFGLEFKEIFRIDELRKNKEFYKFVLAFLIFNSGNYVFLPFLFIYIFDLGFPTSDLILTIGLGGILVIIFSYVLGRLADKYGRKKFLAPIILIGSFGFFLIPFLAMTAEPIMPLYITAFTLILVIYLGIQTPLNAFHQDLLPEEKRGKFLGILNITHTLSQVIGASVGGIVASLFGINWIFAFAPIFYISSIPLFLKIKETLANPS